MEGLYLLDKEPSLFAETLVNHNNLAELSSLSQIIQVSDLSGFDGKVLAYRAYDG